MRPSPQPCPSIENASMTRAVLFRRICKKCSGSNDNSVPYARTSAHSKPYFLYGPLLIQASPRQGRSAFCFCRDQHCQSRNELHACDSCVLVQAGRRRRRWMQVRLIRLCLGQRVGASLGTKTPRRPRIQGSVGVWSNRFVLEIYSFMCGTRRNRFALLLIVLGPRFR